MPQKGFLASLFDLSFTNLVTTKVIKFVYVITLIAIALLALVFIVAAFNESAGYGVVTLLIIAPVLSLLYVVYTRVILEFIIAIFRIMEYQRDLLALAREQQQPARPISPSPPGSSSFGPPV